MRTSISYAFIGSLWCVHVVQLGGAISRSHYLSVLVYSDEQASEYPNIFGKFSLVRIFGIFGHTQSSARIRPHYKKVVLSAGFDPATIKTSAIFIIHLGKTPAIRSGARNTLNIFTILYKKMPLNRFLHPTHIRWAVRISEYIWIQKACPNIRIFEYTNDSGLGYALTYGGRGSIRTLIFTSPHPAASLRGIIELIKHEFKNLSYVDFLRIIQ